MRVTETLRNATRDLDDLREGIVHLGLELVRNLLEVVAIDVYGH